MKVALIAGARWLGQERGTLRRLVVGLVDEMVRVVRIAPQPVGDASAEQWLISADPLWYIPTEWNWWRDRQLRRLAVNLREMEVDLIHALDGTLEGGACGLADAAGLPVLCSAWSESEVQALRGPGGEAGRAYAAASSALAGAVRQRLGPAVTVECVPPGVYATQDELKNPPLQRASESLCCVVVGNGCYDGFYRALLEGIGRSRQRLPGAMYFFYTTGADQHQIWQAAERMELLEQVSLVPAGTDARQLMTQADVLLQPQPLHAVHTVVLEAMAAGRPVIAAADPLVDHLIEGRTARLMAEPDALQWAGHLTCLAQAPQQYMALGRSARQYILDHHRASAFAGSLHRLYERLAAPAVIPFR